MVFSPKTVPQNAIFIFLHIQCETHFAFFCESRFAFSFFSFSLKIHNILFLFFFLSAFLLHRKAAEFGISLRTFFRNPLFQAFFQQKNPAQGFPAQGFLILFLFIFLIFILGYSRSFWGGFFRFSKGNSQKNAKRG